MEHPRGEALTAANIHRKLDAPIYVAKSAWL